MSGFNYRKAIQALSFFAIKEGGVIKKMKAIKLIWLSDRAHLRKYGRLILMDTYYAMKLGPVPSKTKDLCECGNTFLDDIEKETRDQYIKPLHGNLDFESLKDSVDKNVFSETELKIMEEVYTSYGKYSEFALSNTVSHEFPEWKRWKEKIKKQDSSRFNIDYADFFKNPDNEIYFDKLPKEHLEISRSIFEENQPEYC